MMLCDVVMCSLTIIIRREDSCVIILLLVIGIISARPPAHSQYMYPMYLCIHVSMIYSITYVSTRSRSVMLYHWPLVCHSLCRLVPRVAPTDFIFIGNIENVTQSVLECSMGHATLLLQLQHNFCYCFNHPQVLN